MGIFSRNKKNEYGIITEQPQQARPIYNRIWLGNMCRNYGFNRSSNEKTVDGILNALNRSIGFCPCGGEIGNPDHKCPCKSMRDGGICKCGLFDSITETPRGSSTSSVVDIRRIGEDTREIYMSVVPIQSNGEDDQTLVIQYNGNDINTIKNIVHNYKRKNAESYIDQWRMIEIFVNINSDMEMHGKQWLRIVYECMDNNPDPSPSNGRFPGASIIRIRRTLDKPVVTLDMLLEGR